MPYEAFCWCGRQYPSCRLPAGRIGSKGFAIKELRGAHFKSRCTLGKIAPTGHGGVFKCGAMAGAGEIEGKVRFRQRVVLRVRVHAEHVEPHAEHVREVSLEVFVVIDADAVQEIRPRQQAANGKVRGYSPRLLRRWQSESGERIERLGVAVDTEDDALMLEEVEDGIEKCLIAGCSEQDSPAGGADLILFMTLEPARLNREDEVHIPSRGCSR